MKKQLQVGEVYFGIIIFRFSVAFESGHIKNKSLQLKIMHNEWVEFLVFTIFRQLFDTKNSSSTCSSVLTVRTMNSMIQ